MLWFEGLAGTVPARRRRVLAALGFKFGPRVSIGLHAFLGCSSKPGALLMVAVQAECLIFAPIERLRASSDTALAFSSSNEPIAVRLQSASNADARWKHSYDHSGHCIPGPDTRR